MFSIVRDVLELFSSEFLDVLYHLRATGSRMPTNKSFILGVLSDARKTKNSTAIMNLTPASIGRNLRQIYSRQTQRTALKYGYC